MTVRTGLSVMLLISSSSTHAAAGETWSSTMMTSLSLTMIDGVADDGQRAGADGVVDAVLDLVEPERLPVVPGSGRPLSLGQGLNRRRLKHRNRQEHETDRTGQRNSSHQLSL